MPNPMTFSRAALSEIDRRAVSEYHIPILVLMENAGRAVVEEIRKRIAPGARVLIAIGSGNNGGDGLVIARHLHNAGIDVTILPVAPVSKFGMATMLQLSTILAMQLPILEVDPTLTSLHEWFAAGGKDDLIVDAIFGTGLSREITGLPRDVINTLNTSGRSIIAVDIPSGIDCDTGQPLGTAIRAKMTVSFCGYKSGFVNAHDYTGEITVGDIGAPRELLVHLAE